MTPTRRHNPLARISDDVLLWLGFSVVIAATLVPAVLEAIARS